MRMKIGGGGNEAGAMYHLIATAKGLRACSDVDVADGRRRAGGIRLLSERRASNYAQQQFVR